MSEPKIIDIIHDIINDIKRKEKELDKHLLKYYKNVLMDFVNISQNNHFLSTIRHIKFNFPKKTSHTDWKITYIHETEHYNTANYCYDIASESELRRKNTDNTRRFKVIFGYKGGKYFINMKNTEISLYTNKYPFLYNLNYEYEIGVYGEDVDHLIKRYSRNPNIPEWLAIKFFLLIRKREITPDKIWDIMKIIIY